MAESQIIIGQVENVFQMVGGEKIAPAKLRLGTKAGPCTIAIWPKSNYETGEVYVPYQLGDVWENKIQPFLDDMDLLIGREVAITAAPDRDYRGEKQMKNPTTLEFLDDAPAPADAPAAPQPVPAAKDAPPRAARIDPYRDSIERQTAAKAATDVGCATKRSGQDFYTSHWDIWFDHIIARIQNTPAPNGMQPDEDIEDGDDSGDAVLGTV